MMKFGVEHECLLYLFFDLKKLYYKINNLKNTMQSLKQN